jgi:hypothetical protein
VEPVKDWRSDCLGKQNLLGLELCGVLGRLHSIEGLAQSNNNAKLNYSAKHEQKFLETSAKAEDSEGIKREKRFGGRGKVCGADPRETTSRNWLDGHSSVPFLLLFFFYFFSFGFNSFLFFLPNK